MVHIHLMKFKWKPSLRANPNGTYSTIVLQAGQKIPLYVINLEVELTIQVELEVLAKV